MASHDAGVNAGATVSHAFTVCSRWATGRAHRGLARDLQGGAELDAEHLVLTTIVASAAPFSMRSDVRPCRFYPAERTQLILLPAALTQKPVRLPLVRVRSRRPPFASAVYVSLFTTCRYHRLPIADALAVSRPRSRFVVSMGKLSGNVQCAVVLLPAQELRKRSLLSRVDSVLNALQVRGRPSRLAKD